MWLAALAEAMAKGDVIGSTRRRQRRLGPADAWNAVEGHVAEICRDLAVQTKRMRQLQEQADELRAVIRQWVRRSDPAR
jgi:hypothetical protein